MRILIVKLRPALGLLLGAIAVGLLAGCNGQALAPTGTPSVASSSPGAATPAGETPTAPVGGAAVSVAPTETPTAVPPLATQIRPAPTADIPPTATSTAASPQSAARGVDRSALEARAWEFLTELTIGHSPRASATAQEAEAAAYLASIYRGLGYETAVQSFDVRVLVTEPPVLGLTISRASTGTPVAIPSVDARPLRLSVESNASGLLSHVGMVIGDLRPGSLAGKVALIERGIIPFELKVSRVARAGAVAAVIYNNEPGQFSGTLTTQSAIPAASISMEAGQAILQLMSTGQVQASVAIAHETRQSRNVVAEKRGTAVDPRVVVLGAHFDTVPDVPGANDNGSGVATLLAIAEAIKGRDYPFTIRFIDFGSEELGLEGSDHYVASLSPEERRRITAMLNFDALGTGSSAGVFGSPELVDKALDAAAVLGVTLDRETEIRGGSSDFASFEAAGVPFLFFLADDFSLIHTPQDALNRVDRHLLGVAAAAATMALDSLAIQPPRS